MMKITGLDKLTRDLAEAQKATEDLSGELGTVKFDPNDPGSIEAAINEVARLVDCGLVPTHPIRSLDRWLSK
jgi:hypothetical protein